MKTNKQTNEIEQSIKCKVFKTKKAAMKRFERETTIKKIYTDLIIPTIEKNEELNCYVVSWEEHEIRVNNQRIWDAQWDLKCLEESK